LASDYFNADDEVINRDVLKLISLEFNLDY